MALLQCIYRTSDANDTPTVAYQFVCNGFGGHIATSIVSPLFLFYVHFAMIEYFVCIWCKCKATNVFIRCWRARYHHMVHTCTPVATLKIQLFAQNIYKLSETKLSNKKKIATTTTTIPITSCLTPYHHRIVGVLSYIFTMTSPVLSLLKLLFGQFNV